MPLFLSSLPSSLLPMSINLSTGQYQEELKEAKGVAVAKPTPHVILATLKMGPSEYVLDVIKKVRAR